jgi:hypothetical protein
MERHENLDFGDDAFTAMISGSLNGKNDPDKPFHGDKIAFETLMTFSRVAGRVAYSDPELETSGEIDMSDYYDDENS